ncbi:MAG: DUF2147 domain-containing protein [Sphingomicrobium sp.]
MKTILTFLALGALLASSTATAATKAPLEGQWKNPKGTVVVEVGPCGGTYCGTVVQANAKARAKARQGGTPNLIGTRIMTDMRAIGAGVYKGKAFDPKRNIHAPATIRVLGPSLISIKGCLVGGFICKEQRWTRVG